MKTAQTTLRQTPTLLALVLVGLGVTMRFLPHPANIAPVAGLALFSGAYLRRWHAFAIPITTMVISDAFIGFHSLVWATWGCFAATTVIGIWVGKRRSLRRVIAGSFSGSLLFYLVTNWAVWAFTPLYEKSVFGLFQSYVAALPFFRNTIAGDLFYAAVFFGIAEGATLLLVRRASQRHSSSPHGYTPPP